MEVDLHQNLSLGANLAKPSRSLVAYVGGGLLLLAAVMKTVQGVPPLWTRSMLGQQAIALTGLAVVTEAALGTLLILRGRSRPLLHLGGWILRMAGCRSTLSGQAFYVLRAAVKDVAALPIK